MESTYILYKSLSLLSSGRGDRARLTDVHRCRSTLNTYPIRTFLRSLSAWMPWSRVRFILAYACRPAPHVTFENRQRTYLPARESNRLEYARAIVRVPWLAWRSTDDALCRGSSPTERVSFGLPLDRGNQKKNCSNDEVVAARRC